MMVFSNGSQGSWHYSIFKDVPLKKDSIAERSAGLKRFEGPYLSWLEHLLCKQDVKGSNPLGSTKYAFEVDLEESGKTLRAYSSVG